MRLPWNKKPTTVPATTALAVVKNEIEEFKVETYTWNSEELRQRALETFGFVQETARQGFENQAALHKTDIIKIALTDLLIPLGREVKPIKLRQIVEKMDTGLYRLDDNIVTTWMLYRLDNKVVKMPQEALQITDKISQLQTFIEDSGILQKLVDKKVVANDRRFSPENRYQKPALVVIHDLDPMLVVKIGGEWFSLYEWE
jgi:hypothetical protein